MIKNFLSEGDKSVRHSRMQRLIVIISLALIFFTNRAGAFSLLGPCDDWMDVQKGFNLPGDIGGPMNIGEGYRWNIPVVTYGFDHSFLNYFGSNGVAAVESAIALLNALPPASSINLSDYSPSALRTHASAQASHLLDLKSMSLFLLLEQMGLTDPVRYAFCLRDFAQQPNSTNYIFNVIERNFDPVNAQSSHFINGNFFTYFLRQSSWTPMSNAIFCQPQPLSVDPNALDRYPVATTYWMDNGKYFMNLTPDDVGGLRYLLSGNQVRFEHLLPDVHARGTNQLNLISGAYRPGIEKVRFVRHPFGSLTGQFGTFTNQWTDIFYDWDGVYYQNVERITARPDIIFSADDLLLSSVTRTGTTNWKNNAAENDNPGGVGPGVIRPPMTLTFITGAPLLRNVYSPLFINDGMSELAGTVSFIWGSFDNSTNAPITYPQAQIPFSNSQVRFRLSVGGSTNTLAWSLSGAANGRFQFQTSTNMIDWATLAQMTNSGALFNYQYQGSESEPKRFFRTVRLP